MRETTGVTHLRPDVEQPDRQVVGIVGDGATCYVPQSLWTLAHHDIPATIVVLNNGGYYILKSQLLGMNQKAVNRNSQANACTPKTWRR